MKATATTSFYFQQEMWLKDETKDVSAHNVHELKQLGLVVDAKNGETEGAKAPNVQTSFAEQHDPAYREKKPTKAKIEKK